MQYFAIAIATALMQASPAAIDQARLGPIRVAATTVDDRTHWVNYTVRSNLATDVGVTFWSFEIVRSYADGSQVVSVQEQDFLESQVIACAAVSSLLDFSHGVRPSARGEHAHPATNVGRRDAPMNAWVVPIAVMLSDGSVFGDRSRIDGVINRRQRFLREYAAWLHRMEQAQATLPGLMGLRYFEDQISNPEVGSRDVTTIRESFRRVVEGLILVIERGDPEAGQIERAIKNANALLDTARHASQMTLH